MSNRPSKKEVFRGVPTLTTRTIVAQVPYGCESIWICATDPRISVALGSSGKWRNPGSREWWDRMAQAMRVATDGDGMPLTKLHGLRMLRASIISHVPFASADSCNSSRNVGYDKRWVGTYVPSSKTTKAIVLIDRIESHATAHRWNGKAAGVQENWELVG